MKFKNFLKFRRTKKKPRINILTRTSNRPNYFKICYNSIKIQTYKNVRHIVSYDALSDLSYLKEYKVDLLAVEKTISPTTKPIDVIDKEFKPYNLYCNDLLKEVKEGWIIFLDDDDMLANKKVFKEIVKCLKLVNEDTLIFFQTRFPDGRLRPPTGLFKKNEIVYKKIDTACFMFHSKYKDAVLWDCWRGADYRFIRDLSKIIPNQKWLDQIITQKNNFGDHGNRNDIQSIR